MEIFPKHVRELWSKWELRVLVLLSLTWQVILILSGSRRKLSRRSFISGLVWVVYLSADWLATVSLGTLANSQGDEDTSVSDSHEKNHVLQAMWAPFLLLHLGGPDTITAYSLEDNSLWLRHLLGLLIQVIVAIYIYIRSWSSSALTFIAIPVFISGVIKYSERTWVLRSASAEQFEDSLLSAPPLPDKYPKDFRDQELDIIHKGWYLFPLLKRLYADLSLRRVEGRRSSSLITKEEMKLLEITRKEREEAIHAFKLMEVQLGLLYDVLYTKAPIIYSRFGIGFRLISVVSVVSAMVAFIVFVDKHAYSRIDIVITYVLFVGAVLLEIYAFISLIFSDWTRRWLTKNNSSVRKFIGSAISYSRSIFTCTCKKTEPLRWSESMAQHSLLSFCLKNRVVRCIGYDWMFKIYFTLELYWQREQKEVDVDLKRFIFVYLLEKHNEYNQSQYDYNVLKELLSYRGNYVLSKNKHLDAINWSVKVEFDHSLLLWHIATDICYFSTMEKGDDDERKASKKLSDYMLYILLMRPFMLPKWIDRIKHVRDTFREATKLLHRRQLHVKKCTDASKVLIQMHKQSNQPLERLRKGKTGKSLLIDGCILASQLQKLGYPWKMICQVWIEMLTYGASQCEWEAHAQQLRRGGELLTHVSLLMADLGLSQQFVIESEGPEIESQNEGWGCLSSKILDPYF